MKASQLFLLKYFPEDKFKRQQSSISKQFNYPGQGVIGKIPKTVPESWWSWTLWKATSQQTERCWLSKRYLFSENSLWKEKPPTEGWSLSNSKKKKIKFSNLCHRSRKNILMYVQNIQLIYIIKLKVKELTCYSPLLLPTKERCVEKNGEWAPLDRC